MKEITIILLSSIKFAMTFPLAVLRFEIGFFQTVLWTNTGGFLGIIFFTYVSEWLIKLWRKYFRRSISDSKNRLITLKKRKIFSSRSRRIVRIKLKYGLSGIAFFTPLLFSIPIGTFLAVRYFRSRKTNVLYLTASNLIWSVIYTSFYTFCYEIYVHW